MIRRYRQTGQAVVELALMMTFVALLLGAAVDLGLAYKQYQMLVNASSEAASFLAQQPLVSCGSTCDETAMRAAADARALDNFRNEVASPPGMTRRSGLRDLNGDGRDDMLENGWTIATYRSGGWLRIDPADAGQVNLAQPGAFNAATFTPTTLTQCVNRLPDYPGGQCYVVVRARMIYRPFMNFGTFLRNGVTIRAYAVKPIVGGS